MARRTATLERDERAAQPRRRRRFTADEFLRMVEADIVHEDSRVELIEGDLIEMAAIGSQHLAAVNVFTMLLTPRLVGRAIVSVQNAARLSEYTVPQPDIVLLRPRTDHYRHGLPAPADVLLMIEVSDSSLRFDRDRKVPLYARAGIPEVWIANIPAASMLVYREPVDGVYRHTSTVRRGGVLAPLAFPDLVLTVNETFGEEGPAT